MAACSGAGHPLLIDWTLVCWTAGVAGLRAACVGWTGRAAPGAAGLWETGNHRNLAFSVEAARGGGGDALGGVGALGHLRPKSFIVAVLGSYRRPWRGLPDERSPFHPARGGLLVLFDRP